MTALPLIRWYTAVGVGSGFRFVTLVTVLHKECEMLQKLFIIAALFVSAVFFIVTTGYADTIISDINLDFGINYEGKGSSGWLTPHFSHDPAIGGYSLLQWREFRAEVLVARYLGFLSLIGDSGHTTFSAHMRKKVGTYDLDFGYSHVRMESVLPSWLPWITGNRQEIFLKAGYQRTGRWYPYALGGGVLAGDAIAVVGGIGSVIRFPVSRRIDFVADGHAATSLFGHDSGDYMVFGKVSGSFLFAFQRFPISLKGGLHVFKKVGDNHKAWTVFTASYTFL